MMIGPRKDWNWIWGIYICSIHWVVSFLLSYTLRYVSFGEVGTSVGLCCENRCTCVHEWVRRGTTGKMCDQKGWVVRIDVPPEWTCSLWIKKSRVNMTRIHWVARGTGTPKDKDEVHKSEACDLEGTNERELVQKDVRFLGWRRRRKGRMVVRNCRSQWFQELRR